MKEPIDHILRPQLPWRTDAGMTECGLNAANLPTTLTRVAFIQRVKNLGRQRAAMITCMTCAGTATRWGTWDDDPRAALEREIQWEGYGQWKDHGQRLRDELLAIAHLIKKYREEFDAHIAHTEQRRAWLEKKAASAAKPKISGNSL